MSSNEGFPSSRRHLKVSLSSWQPPTCRQNQRSLAARDGIKYERKLGKWLTGWSMDNRPWRLHPQQAFEDTAGIHIPDFILHNRETKKGVIFESKLSFKQEGIEQLMRYAPVVASFYDSDFTLCLICKHLNSSASAFPLLPSSSALNSLLTADSEGPYVWHAPWPEYLSVGETKNPSELLSLRP